MIKNIKHPHLKKAFKTISLIVLLCFFTTVVIPSQALAQGTLGLPVPGTMVSLSPAFTPAILRGMRVYPENSLKFDFIVDSGNTGLKGDQLKEESQKIVKYFLAALTIPEDDLWVNLSPYEENRIIPDALGQTEMGIDLLAQDYILKQLMSSLIYPEDEFGKEFWKKVYKKAYEEYGTTNIPIDTFNKVWIVPQKAVLYEDKDRVFITDSYLKVMMEQDYLALEENKNVQQDVLGEEKDQKQEKEADSALSASIAKEVIIPLLEKEVNEGKNFAHLRQIFHSMVLAVWYKEALRESIITKVYADKNKVVGVQVPEERPVNVDNIYDQYLAAYEKGVVNYLKTEFDPYLKKYVTRKYFSGGFEGRKVSSSIVRKPLRALKNVAQTITVGLAFTAAVILAAPLSTSATPEFDDAPFALSAGNSSTTTSQDIKIIAPKDIAVPSLSVEDIPSFDDPPLPEDTVGEMEFLSEYEYAYGHMPKDLRDACEKQQDLPPNLDLIVKYPTHTYTIYGEDVKVYVVPVEGLSAFDPSSPKASYDYGDKGHVLYVDSNFVNDTAYLESQKDIVQRHIRALRNSKRTLWSLGGSLALLVLGMSGFCVNRDKIRPKMYKSFLKKLSNQKYVQVEFDENKMTFFGPKGSRLKVTIDKKYYVKTNYNRLFLKDIDSSNINQSKKKIFNSLISIISKNKNFSLSSKGVKSLVYMASTMSSGSGFDFVKSMLGTAMINNQDVFYAVKGEMSGLNTQENKKINSSLEDFYISAMNNNPDLVSPLMGIFDLDIKEDQEIILLRSLFQVLQNNREIKLKKEDFSNILKLDMFLSKFEHFDTQLVQAVIGQSISNNPDLIEDALSIFENPKGEIKSKNRPSYIGFSRKQKIRKFIAEGIQLSQIYSKEGLEIDIQKVINTCKVVSNLDSVRNSREGIDQDTKEILLRSTGQFIKSQPESLMSDLKYIETLLESDSEELKDDHLDSILPELSHVFESLSHKKVILDYIEKTSSEKMRNFLAESIPSIGECSFDQICRILSIKTLSEKGVNKLLEQARNLLAKRMEQGVTQDQFDSMFSAAKRFVDSKRNNIDIESLGRIIINSFLSNPDLKVSKKDFLSLLKYATLHGIFQGAHKEIILGASKVLSHNPDYLDVLIDKIKNAESPKEKYDLVDVGQKALHKGSILSDFISKLQKEKSEEKQDFILTMIITGVSKWSNPKISVDQFEVLVNYFFEKGNSSDSQELIVFLRKTILENPSLLSNLFSLLEENIESRIYSSSLSMIGGLGDFAIAPLEKFTLFADSKGASLDHPTEQLASLVSMSENLTDNKKGYYAQFIANNHSIFNNLKRIKKPNFLNKIIKSDKEKWQLIDFIVEKRGLLMISSESEHEETENIDAFDQIVEKKYKASARGSLPYIQLILSQAEKTRSSYLKDEKEDLLDYNNYFQHFSPIIYEQFKASDNRKQFSQATKKSTKALLEGKGYQEIKSSLDDSGVENVDDYLMDLLLIVSPNSNASANRQTMKDLVNHGVQNEELWQSHMKNFIGLVDRDIANNIIQNNRNKMNIKENSIGFSNEMLVVEKKLKSLEKISHERVDAMFSGMENSFDEKNEILDILMPQEKEKQDQYLQRVKPIFLSWLGSNDDMKQRVKDVQAELDKGSHIAYSMIIETIRDIVKERMQSLKEEEKYDVVRENLIKVLGVTENIAYKNDGDIAQMFKKIVKSTPARLTKGKMRNFEELSEGDKKQALKHISNEFSKMVSKFAVETAPNLKKRWGKIATLILKEYCTDQDLDQPTELSKEIEDIFSDLISNETLLVAADRVYEDISKKSNEKIVESLFEISKNNSDINSLKGDLLTFMEKYAIEVEDKANLRWKKISDIVSGRVNVGWSKKLPKTDSRLAQAIDSLLGEASLPFAEDPLNYAIPVLIRTIFNEEIREANINLNQFYEQAVGVEFLEIEAMKSPWQALFGTVSNICIYNDVDMFDRETLIPLALKANGEYVGYVLLHNIEKNGQRFLLVAGIEPSEKYLEMHSARSVYDAVMENVVDLAKVTGASEVGISANPTATSNRPEISDIIVKGGYERDALGYEHKIGGQYTSDDYYAYWSSKKEVSQGDVLKLKEKIPESLAKIIDVDFLLQKDRSSLNRIDIILKNKESIPYLEQMYRKVYEVLGTKEDAQAIVTNYVPVLFQHGGKPFDRVTVSLSAGENAQGLNNIVIYSEGGIKIQDLKDQQEVVLAQGQMASSQFTTSSQRQDVTRPDEVGGIDTPLGGIDTPLGGIDLNADYLDIEKRGSSPIEFNVPVEWVGMNLENLPGLVPASISITPLINFSGFLGFDDSQENSDQQLSQNELIGDKLS